MAREVGRPSDLTDELFIKIKELVLDGNNLKEIAKACGIPEITVYTWHSNNYLDFYNKVENWKRDRKLILADITSDTIQTLPIIDENGKLDKELLKIKQKESEFIRETLGKQNYSKRVEQTGKDGKDITHPSNIVITDEDFGKILKDYAGRNANRDKAADSEKDI